MDMWTGLRWLNLLAIVLYLLSYLLLRRPSSTVSATQPQMVS